MTPQNWTLGRGQTGKMLGFIIIQLNETRVVEFAKKNQNCVGQCLWQQCRKRRRKRKTLDATKLDSWERTNRKDVGVGKLFLNCCSYCETYSMRHNGRIYQITKLVQVHHYKTITFLYRKVLHFLTVKQGIIPRM